MILASHRQSTINAYFIVRRQTINNAWRQQRHSVQSCPN
jgi:hypothetical protein